MEKEIIITKIEERKGKNGSLEYSNGKPGRRKIFGIKVITLIEIIK